MQVAPARAELLCNPQHGFVITPAFLAITVLFLGWDFITALFDPLVADEELQHVGDIIAVALILLFNVRPQQPKP
jgi:hypothetical protein